ncbi:MAG TPA: PilN domain-containing protein [Candidatus Aquilonibacter sp.]|nr:PilN domain-containing protein [Candidatus Aquilonibacter sp.]
MRISINLATRPFVELRPLFLRLRILMALLAAIAIALGVWAHKKQQQLNIATAQMDSLRDQTMAAQQERLHNEARMRQGPNAAVLDRAHFLNRLFLEKSFSWTAVMMDLENVLPTGVQVTSIDPMVSPGGDVIIRLRVSGERDRAVQLVRNLEHSRRFLNPRLSGEAAQAKQTVAQRGGFVQPQMNAAPPGVEFDILANYNPLPESEPYSKPASAANASGTAAVRGEGR